MDQLMRRPPGPISGRSSRGGSGSQLSSRFWTHPWLDLGDRVVLGARIFFRTRESALDGEDRMALTGLADALRLILQRGHEVQLVCRGYADIRPSAPSNYQLSLFREQSVTVFLKQCLAGLPNVTFSGQDLGDTYASSDSQRWSEDRRVDVFVKVTPSFARGDPTWAKRRADIFKKYYPRYSMWKERGLEYLVDQYELHDQEAVPVQIKPSDYDKVLELVLLLASSDDAGNIRQWAQGSRRNREIADAYCVEYRKAYDVAYQRYQAAGKR